jgi:GDP-L-fucose synthase
MMPQKVFLLAAEKYDDPDPVNLGSGYEISIKDLAETIARLSGFRGNWYGIRASLMGSRAVHSMFHVQQQYFGFKAQMDFEEGLRRTIEWYRAQNEAEGGTDDRSRKLDSAGRSHHLSCAHP